MLSVISVSFSSPINWLHHAFSYFSSYVTVKNQFHGSYLFLCSCSFVHKYKKIKYKKFMTYSRHACASVDADKVPRKKTNWGSIFASRTVFPRCRIFLCGKYVKLVTTEAPHYPLPPTSGADWSRTSSFFGDPTLGGGGGGGETQHLLLWRPQVVVVAQDRNLRLFQTTWAPTNLG